jgi:hypothetical protein
MKIKNKKTIVRVGILIVIFVFLLFTGCTAMEKISRNEAIRIALNDTRTIQAINNSAFNVSEVSTANLGVGTGSQEEVYYISIKVLDGTNKRVIVFVTYDGTVAFVDTPCPRITPPGYLANDSVRMSSG